MTALESCACTQDKNSAAVVSRISTNVLDYCGSTAAEDVTSADFVFSAYCNQATVVKVPSGGPVTQYITDLPAFSELGGCAQSAISYAVQPLTYSNCPPAASLLVSSSTGLYPNWSHSNSRTDLDRQVVLAQKTKMLSLSANKLILTSANIVAQRTRRIPHRLRQFSRAIVGWKQAQRPSQVRQTCPET